MQCDQTWTSLRSCNFRRPGLHHVTRVDGTRPPGRQARSSTAVAQTTSSIRRYDELGRAYYKHVGVSYVVLNHRNNYQWTHRAKK
jgi:hypothetical protein